MCNESGFLPCSKHKSFFMKSRKISSKFLFVTSHNPEQSTYIALRYVIFLNTVDVVFMKQLSFALYLTYYMKPQSAYLAASNVNKKLLSSLSLYSWRTSQRFDLDGYNSMVIKIEMLSQVPVNLMLTFLSRLTT